MNKQIDEILAAKTRITDKVVAINLLIASVGNDKFLTEKHFIEFSDKLGAHALNIHSAGITVRHALRKLMNIPANYSMYGLLDNLLDMIYESDEDVNFDEYDMYFKPHHVNYCLEVQFDPAYTDEQKKYIAANIYDILGNYRDTKILRDYHPLTYYKENTIMKILMQ